MIETWQADPDGRFAHPDDPRGAVEWAASAASPAARRGDGNWSVLTLKPGAVPGPGGRLQAPHIAVSVFARGLLAAAGHADLLRRRGGGQRRRPGARHPARGERPAETLIAAPIEGGYRFDIRLQGQDETVFFAV